MRPDPQAQSIVFAAPGVRINCGIAKGYTRERVELLAEAASATLVSAEGRLLGIVAASPGWSIS